MNNVLKKIILLVILFLGYTYALYGQTTYQEMYSVEGIYTEVSEEEALDHYHYLEYDDHYYIKEKFEEGETHSLKILKVINPKLYFIVWEDDVQIYTYYMNLRYPSYLWKGEEFIIKLSNVVDSDLIKEEEIEFIL